MRSACDECGCTHEECECAERRVVPDYVTMRGLPALGLDGPLENGFHVVSLLIDPIKNLELRPARIYVHDGKITQYGMVTLTRPMWVADPEHR